MRLRTISRSRVVLASLALLTLLTGMGLVIHSVLAIFTPACAQYETREGAPAPACAAGRHISLIELMTGFVVIVIAGVIGVIYDQRRNPPE